jgi:hypothetical protein
VTSVGHQQKYLFHQCYDWVMVIEVKVLLSPAFGAIFIYIINERYLSLFLIETFNDANCCLNIDLTTTTLDRLSYILLVVARDGNQTHGFMSCWVLLHPKGKGVDAFFYP